MREILLYWASRPREGEAFSTVPSRPWEEGGSEGGREGEREGGREGEEGGILESRLHTGPPRSSKGNSSRCQMH